jgi:hypothetical protein
MSHGDRSKIRDCDSPFECTVCGRQRDAGTSTVGFRNLNRGSNAARRPLWDHCCAGCAPSYVLPPLVPKSLPTQHPSPFSTASSSATPTTASTSAGRTTTSFSTDGTSGSVTGNLERFLAQADLLVGMSGDDATIMWERAGGDATAANDVLFSSIGHMDAPPRPVARRDPAADTIALPPLAVAPTLTSDEARGIIARIFMAYVQPLIPKLGDDGTLSGGDRERLNVALTEPIVVTPPRAELMAAACRPADGWTDEAKESARSCFAMAAVGLRFALFEPAVTHFDELARSEHFQVCLTQACAADACSLPMHARASC